MGIHVVVYDKEACEPPRVIATSEIADMLAQPNAVVWAEIDQPDDEAVGLMRDIFHFHPLAIEDTRNQRQRPKVEEFPGYLFTILNSVSLQGEDVEFTEVDVFAGQKFVVTAHIAAEPWIDEARRRADVACALMPMSSGHLLYILLDVAVDSYFPILDRIGDEIDDIGDAIFEAPRPQNIQRLFRLKRALNEMARVVSQQRDMFMLLTRENNKLVTDESLRYYMRDVYDHLLRIGDNVNTFRETLTGVVDLYMSAVSNRLNQQVNRLTIITIGTGILAVVTGFYGMNFERTWPPFSAPWGVPFVLAIICAILAGILVYLLAGRQH